LELLGFWDCGEAKGGMNNQFLITGFSITEKNPIFLQDRVR
jgi:hypothetical protein